MRQRLLCWSGTAIMLAMAGLLLSPLSAVPATAQEPQKPASTAALLSEVRNTFTLGGERIPPEIFRDFGDGNMADSVPIWVTVDLRAAIGSNLYADDISQRGDWIIQRKPAPDTMNGAEYTTYKFIGTAENGLLLVLASYSGGGTGSFVTLHLLSLDAVPAFDSSGEVYDRITLTNLRAIPLGDRWDGEVGIAKNTVRVVTTRNGPADRTGVRAEMSFEAKKP
jgi:hypothetical protein